jgi:hypothetical protein
MAHHEMFMNHLTCVLFFKDQLYVDTWQLRPTYFFNLKILIKGI